MVYAHDCGKTAALRRGKAGNISMVTGSMSGKNNDLPSSLRWIQENIEPYSAIIVMTGRN